MSGYSDYLVLHSSILLALFAAGIFVVLNGPLWLSRRARIFAGGPKAPVWLDRGVSWFSRLMGVAVLATWAWVATESLKPASLLGLVVVIGVFCLFDGVWRVITGAHVFRGGPEAPVWMVSAAVWFLRVVGVVAVLSGLVVSIIPTG